MDSLALQSHSVKIGNTFPNTAFPKDWLTNLLYFPLSPFIVSNDHKISRNVEN